MTRRLRNPVLLLLITLIVAWLVVRSWSDPVRFEPGRLQDLPRGLRTLKVVSFNIAHARGVGLNQIFTSNGTLARNLEALGDYLRWEAADLVLLQEIDEDCLWSGNVNQAELLAERAGYPYWWIGANNTLDWPLASRYGNAILSRHRIIAFRNTAFGEALVGEKGFFEARITLGEGRYVTVLGAHLHHASADEREAQAARMASRIAAVDEPLIVAGDLNVAPDAREQTLALLRRGDRLLGWELDRPGEPTFHALAPSRRIDYILASRHFDLVEQRVRPLALSDHRPVVAVLRFHTPVVDEERDPADSLVTP